MARGTGTSGLETAATSCRTGRMTVPLSSVAPDSPSVPFPPEEVAILAGEETPESESPAERGSVAPLPLAGIRRIAPGSSPLLPFRSLNS